MFGVFYLSRCFVLCPMYLFFRMFVALLFRLFSACDFALCVIALYGNLPRRLPNLETSLFGSCMLCHTYACDAHALPNLAHALFA